MRAIAEAGWPIRVLAVDHTAGVAPYRRRHAAIAAHPGIELTVLAPDRWVENYATVRVDARRPVAVDGYRLRSGSVVWPGYENRGFFTSGLAGAFRDARPDILHLWEEPFSLIALQALWLRRRLAPASVAIFTSADNVSLGFRYVYRPAWLYARIERYAHRECAAGVAISEEVAAVLRDKGYRGALEVLPLGLDLAAYPARDNSSRPSPVIGYVGRLTPQKGVDVLLRAVAALPSRADGTTPSLLIVGDGPAKRSLEALAGSLGLSNRVRFRSAVPHDAVPEILRGIDILVLPSRTLPTVKEQFGRVLIEGMAAGCVVIGSSSGAIGDVIGDAGLVFPEEDASALAAALTRALEEPGLAASFRERGRARVAAHYTWDAIAERIVRLYRHLLAGTRGSGAATG